MKRLNKNRKLVPVWILAVPAATSIALGCAVAGDTENSASALATPTGKTKTMNIQIKVGKKRFTATFEDNATAKAFKALLPMTMQMTELDGNEKYFRLSVNLPTNASTPRTIQTGDLMIYGQN